MTPLEKGQLSLLRIHALIGSLVLAAGAAILEIWVMPELGLPRGLAAAPFAILILYLVLVSPGKQYRGWSYAFDTEELHIAHGVWTRVETVVPLDRVQHIDVSQGPLERALGLTRLIVHTAGTQHSIVVLPGLSRLTAETMRDEIRARIRRETE